jgi:hypothetical protein
VVVSFSGLDSGAPGAVVKPEVSGSFIY